MPKIFKNLRINSEKYVIPIIVSHDPVVVGWDSLVIIQYSRNFYSLIAYSRGGHF